MKIWTSRLNFTGFIFSYFFLTRVFKLNCWYILTFDLFPLLRFWNSLLDKMIKQLILRIMPQNIIPNTFQMIWFYSQQRFFDQSHIDWINKSGIYILISVYVQRRKVNQLDGGVVTDFFSIEECHHHKLGLKEELVDILASQFIFSIMEIKN